MRTRWVLAVVVALAGVRAAAAQPAQPLPTGPAIPVVPGTAPAAQPDPIPPFLPVPAQPDPPLAVVPRPGAAPGVEYDPGYLYLPEQAPERRLADVCGPPGRWWVTPSLELAWVPTRAAPTNIRLRVPSPFSPGETLPGPVLPVSGLSSGSFSAAMGLAVGHWFDDANTRGVESNFFFRDLSTTYITRVPGALVTFSRGRRGVPQIALLPEPFESRVAGPLPFTLDTFFTTLDVNYRQRLYCDDSARLDALVGYRYAFLGDELYLGDYATNDDYRQNRAAVSNGFHGAQVGLAGEVRANGWYAAGAAKLALGATSADVTSSGVFYGAEGRAGGGYQRLAGLAGASRTTFAVMPSMSVQVGRQVTPHIRLFTGYSFTYLSRAARLGDALAPQNTGLTFNDFWVQSISLGADFRF
jgi:hypothetical protein